MQFDCKCERCICAHLLICACLCECVRMYMFCKCTFVSFGMDSLLFSPVVPTFDSLLKAEPALPVAVAAIRALTLVVQKSTAKTMIQMQHELETGSGFLKRLVRILTISLV
jgi:hypothetical protein